MIVRNYSFITALLILLCFTNATAQSYSDCRVEGAVFVKTEVSAKFTGSLQQYFEHEFKDKFYNFTGTISLNILIDSSGKACCTNIANNNSAVSSKVIKDIVNKMKRWTPATYHSCVVNFSATIQLVFDNSKLSVKYLNEL